MDYIRCIVNEHMLVKNGIKTLQNGFNKLVGNDELFKEFIECHGEMHLARHNFVMMCKGY